MFSMLFLPFVFYKSFFLDTLFQFVCIYECATLMFIFLEQSEIEIVV